MVPRKLVEQFMLLLPVLVLPIVVAPLLTVLLIGDPPPRYQSTATVWATNPTELEVDDLTSEGTRRQTAADRLESALRDLLLRAASARPSP